MNLADIQRCRLNSERSSILKAVFKIDDTMIYPKYETMWHSISMSLLAGMVCGRGSGHSHLKSVSGAGRVRLCGHVNLSLLNSADYPDFPYRKVGARTCTTSSTQRGSGLVTPSKLLPHSSKGQMFELNLIS